MGVVTVVVGVLSLLGFITGVLMLLKRDRLALKIDAGGIHETSLTESRTFLWDEIASIGIDKTIIGNIIAFTSKKRRLRIVSGRKAGYLWQTYSLDSHQLLDRLNHIKDHTGT